MVKNKFINILALGAAASVLFAGCSATSASYQSTLTDAASVDSSIQIIENTPTPEADAASAAETPSPIEPEEVTPSVVEDPLKTIGTKSEGESVYKRKLTNNTGENITAFYVKDQWTEDWPDSMIAVGDSWADGEVRCLYYDASDSLKRQSDYEQKPVYSILLLYEGGEEAVLHDVAFTDFEEAAVAESDGISYLTYKSLSTGEDVSTLSSEQEIAAESAAGTDEPESDETSSAASPEESVPESVAESTEETVESGTEETETEWNPDEGDADGGEYTDDEAAGEGTPDGDVEIEG